VATLLASESRTTTRLLRSERRLPTLAETKCGVSLQSRHPSNRPVARLGAGSVSQDLGIARFQSTPATAFLAPAEGIVNRLERGRNADLRTLEEVVLTRTALQLYRVRPIVYRWATKRPERA
jgi:hypothetical protein